MNFIDNLQSLSINYSLGKNRMNYDCVTYKTVTSLCCEKSIGDEFSSLGGKKIPLMLSLGLYQDSLNLKTLHGCYSY